jgi:hypothetical protein
MKDKDLEKKSLKTLRMADTMRSKTRINYSRKWPLILKTESILELILKLRPNLLKNQRMRGYHFESSTEKCLNPRIPAVFKKPTGSIAKPRLGENE